MVKVPWRMSLSKWPPKLKVRKSFIFKWWILGRSGLPWELAHLWSNSEFSGSHLSQPPCVSLNFPVEVRFATVTSAHFFYTNATQISVTFSYLVICQMYGNEYINIEFRHFFLLFWSIGISNYSPVIDEMSGCIRGWSKTFVLYYSVLHWHLLTSGLFWHEMRNIFVIWLWKYCYLF